MKLHLFRMLDGSSHISGLNRGRNDEQRGVDEREIKSSKVGLKPGGGSFQEIYDCKLSFGFT